MRSGLTSSTKRGLAVKAAVSVALVVAVIVIRALFFG
jgi:hypothetical protein